MGMLRGSLGKAWECFVNASGKLGEAWGGLGNAWECFWGGLERLASLWASASQPKGCFWSTFLHFYAPASQPVASQACSIHGRPSGYIARPGHQASFKKRLPNMSVADKTGHFLAWGDQDHSRTIPLPFQDHSRNIPGPEEYRTAQNSTFQDHSRTIPGPFHHHSRTIPGPFQDPLISVEFVVSCFWAPPVAIQFSVV